MLFTKNKSMFFLAMIVAVILLFVLSGALPGAEAAIKPGAGAAPPSEGGVLALRGKAPAQAEDTVLPVLMYHHFVSAQGVRLNPQTVQASKFENDLAAIRDAGFTTMLPSEVIDAQASGRFPEKPIMITMDDGYLSNYTLAYPLLEKYRMKASVFVIGWSVGRSLMPDNLTPIIPHFNLEAAEKMVESGLVSVGAHSYDLHTTTPQSENSASGVARRSGETDEKYAARLKEDFLKIRALLEPAVGEKLISYSYPFGIESEICRKVLLENGVLMTFQTGEAFSNITRDGLFGIKRLNVTNDMASDTLVKTIEALIEKAR